MPHWKMNFVNSTFLMPGRRLKVEEQLTEANMWAYTQRHALLLVHDVESKELFEEQEKQNPATPCDSAYRRRASGGREGPCT